MQEQRRLVQPELPRIHVPVQQQYQQGTDQRQLFPHPPTQQFQALVVPPVETRNVQCPLQ